MSTKTRFAALLALALLAFGPAPKARADLIFGIAQGRANPPVVFRARHASLPIPRRRPVRAVHEHAPLPRQHHMGYLFAGEGDRFGTSQLIGVARRYLGRGNFTGYREAWCADALRAWLRQSGHSLAGTDHRAISFARYGRPSGPHVGAVAVLRHHVGIVAGLTRRGVILLSGNHSHRVAYGVYPLRRIVAFREPV